MSNKRKLSFSEGEWFNQPEYEKNSENLLVHSMPNTDLWQGTYYGFHRDSAHALLVDFPIGSALEVSFINNFKNLYEQAGIFIRVNEKNWIKAGIEFSDGFSQLSCVVTKENSDWSAFPVPEWYDREITVRASRCPDSIIFRAKTDSAPFRMFRVAHFDGNFDAKAGLFCCSPEQSGFDAKFTGFYIDSADASLH